MVIGLVSFGLIGARGTLFQQLYSQIGKIRKSDKAKTPGSYKSAGPVIRMKEAVKTPLSEYSFVMGAFYQCVRLLSSKDYALCTQGSRWLLVLTDP